MVELVKYIVSQFANNKEAINIAEEKVDERNSVILVKLAQEDMGRVIGKQGKIAKAIRTIVKSASAKSDIRYSVKIDEVEE